ncbi:MAG TPA: ABC transporter permease [Bacteroides sp.]|nr:ABC transporter permease [Bacteroides sp.]
MNLPFYIARRYLLAKKSQNAINIISGISIAGVAVGTMALITILSVFNGFDSIIKSLYNSFDPEIRITIVEGKTFDPGQYPFEKIEKHSSVAWYSEVLEENVLLRYGDRQHIATVKGVDDNFHHVTGIDSMIVDGDYSLWEKNRPKAVVGIGVAYHLAIGLNFLNPINIYVIKRQGNISMNPEQAISRKFIFPSGMFSIEQEINSRYLLVPLQFARELLRYSTEVSAIEISLKEGIDKSLAEQEIQDILGTGFLVKNRNEQNELFYRIMKAEKWAIFFILSFILIIASFNIIGSLTMLILDKQGDIDTLDSLGASASLIKRIFLIEGWLISLTGAFIGIILGSLISWLQQEYGIIKLTGSGSFIIDAYPVVFQFMDVVMVFFTVLGIGFLAAWLPVRYLSRQYRLKRA